MFTQRATGSCHLDGSDSSDNTMHQAILHYLCCILVSLLLPSPPPPAPVRSASAPQPRHTTAAVSTRLLHAIDAIASGITSKALPICGLSPIFACIKHIDISTCIDCTSVPHIERYIDTLGQLMHGTLNQCFVLVVAVVAGIAVVVYAAQSMGEGVLVAVLPDVAR